MSYTISQRARRTKGFLFAVFNVSVIFAHAGNLLGFAESLGALIASAVIALASFALTEVEE